MKRAHLPSIVILSCILALGAHAFIGTPGQALADTGGKSMVAQEIINNRCLYGSLAANIKGIAFNDPECKSTSSSSQGTSSNTSSSSASSSSNSSDGSSGDACTKIQSTYNYLNTLYPSALQNLKQAQSDLTLNSSLYQQAFSKNPNGVKPVDTTSYADCADYGVHDCGGDPSNTTGCNDLNNNCNSLAVKVNSTLQSTCIIEGQAGAFSNAIIPSSNGTSVTTAKSSAGTTTATGSTSTGGTSSSLSTNSVTSPSTSVSSQAFSLTLTPGSIGAGDSFTIHATINSLDVKTYSIEVIKDGQDLGSLENNIAVGDVPLPLSINYTFNISSDVPLGTYVVKILNASIPSESLSANLNVVSPAALSTLGNGATLSSATTALTSSSQESACVDLTSTLQYGDSNSDVYSLQTYLQTGGYLSVTPTGYFGSLTKNAVTAFQAHNGISQIGVAGPLTRNKIKVLSCS